MNVRITVPSFVTSGSREVFLHMFIPEVKQKTCRYVELKHKECFTQQNSCDSWMLRVCEVYSQPAHRMKTLDNNGVQLRAQLKRNGLLALLRISYHPRPVDEYLKKVDLELDLLGLLYIIPPSCKGSSTFSLEKSQYPPQRHKTQTCSLIAALSFPAFNE